MLSFIRSVRTKSLLMLALVLLLTLAACGSTSTGSSGTPAATTSTPKGPITVGGKLDVESQLLTKMYTLLLRKGGFQVNEKPAFGNSILVLNGIKSGALDIYPEFTATGLNALNLTSAHDPQKDYQAVKDGFEQQYKITWLDAAPLNDGYAICTTNAKSASLNIKTISDLAPQVAKLSLASPSDGISFIDNLKPVYNFDTKSFKTLEKVDYSIGLEAVKNNQADAAVCYTTDGTLTSSGFIILQDDKNGFPQFNPAPIVRDQILTQYPDIKTILNPLAPDLTTQVSIDLQKQVSDKKTAGESVAKAVTDVATQFLQSKGLL